MIIVRRAVWTFAFCALVAFGAQRVQAAPQFVWQGRVDGIAILHLRGKGLDVQIQEGAPVQEQTFHFFDALPESRQTVRVEVLAGRGYIHVVDQPSIENHYTAAIGIEDRQAGSSMYSIALYWDTSDSAFQNNADKRDRVSWEGRVDEEAVIDCRKDSCTSSSEHGAPVADERFKFARPLPARDTEVRLEDPSGRGEIRLIEQPRERNGYTARVSIRDAQPGSGEYSFALVWNRASSKDSAKGAAPIPDLTGHGMMWSGTVAGRARVTIKGGATFSESLASNNEPGGRISGEHSDMFRSLPARNGLTPTIAKIRGRGAVSIVEQPSEKNNYRLVFEIDDPGPGSDDYQVELDW